MSSHSTGKQESVKPPVPAKPGTSVKDSSDPESCSQTLPQQTTSHDASVSLDMTCFTGPGTSHYPTGADCFSQDYPSAFTGPPESDDIPLSEAQGSDQEFSGTVSDSEENPLSDSG